MTFLSSPDAETVSEIAARHGFSVDATRSMLAAVVRGGGGMAQFDHPEFSGLGQWMRGGMTMVSDLHDSRLKARVDGLCSDLSAWTARRRDVPDGVAAGGASPLPLPLSPHRAVPADRAASWPAGPGRPSASGSQNGSRYAVFDDACRLAIEQDGRTTVYDTLDHRIGGVSQQQGIDGAIRFTSQHGIVDLERLPRVSASVPTPAAAPASANDTDIPAMIERLGELAARGLLDPAEFRAKKAELLARI